MKFKEQVSPFQLKDYTVLYLREHNLHCVSLWRDEAKKLWKNVYKLDSKVEYLDGG